MLRSALLTLAALLAAAPPAAAQAGQPGQPVTPISLARAREAGAGATVVVDGVVSVAPGSFDGGFAIQDRTGGIWVLPPSDPVLLQIGQRVRIRGTLDNPNNQLAIQPAALQLFQRDPHPSENDVPDPRTVRTGEVDEGQEGWLIRVRGRVVTKAENDAPWGWKVMVDDGTGSVMVFIDAETDVDPERFRLGETVEVTGFAGQYDDHYEVVPRAQFDVRVIRSNN